jgi:hypothetical protein
MRLGAIIAILPGQSPDDAQTEKAQPDYHEHHVRRHLEYFDENDAHAGKRDECPGHHEASTGGSHVRHLLMSVRSAVPKGISQGLARRPISCPRIGLESRFANVKCPDVGLGVNSSQAIGTDTVAWGVARGC